MNPMNSINRNGMDMSYNMRNMMNTNRNVEEQMYDINTMEMMNNNINRNYMRTGGASLNPIYTNDYVSDRENYSTDVMSQIKIDKGMNNCNNTVAPINNSVMIDPNESVNMQGLNTMVDPSNGYESYRNIINYNNTQNTIQANQTPVPMNIENFNFNGNENLYFNEQTGEIYPEEYVKNLPTTIDPSEMSAMYTNGMDFNKMVNGNYNNALMQDNNNYNNNYNNNINNNNINNNNLQYPMPVLEHMNNGTIYMQPQISITPKQTRSIPLEQNTQHNISQQMTQHLMPNIPPSMQSQIAPCTSLRKVPQLNKRKMKPKKFFPCC